MSKGERIPFQLHLRGFDGPVEELVRHVELHHMRPLQLPLTDITSQFAGYVESAEVLDLTEVADFVSTVARLMVWKSKALLEDQAAMPEEYEDSMERRAARDETLLSAAACLRGREGAEAFPAAPRPVERVQEPYAPALLCRAWTDLEQRGRSAAVEVAVPAFVRLEVALSRIVRGLRTQGTVRFTRLLQGSNRNDVVVHFLALLELIRRGEALAKQRQTFGEIDCTVNSNDESLASRIG